MIFPFLLLFSFSKSLLLEDRARSLRLDDSNVAEREREWGDWLRIRRLNTLLATMYRHGTSMKRRYYPDDICWRATYPRGSVENFSVVCAPLNVPRRRSRQDLTVDRLPAKMLRLRWAKRRL